MKRGFSKHPSLLRKERRKIFFAKIGFFSVLVLIILGLAIFGLNYLLIDTGATVVEGNSIVSSGDIKESITRLTEGKYFGLIPKSSILFFPKGEILSALKSAFPILKTIQIKRENLSALTLNVVERKPYGVYCKGTEDMSLQGCIFVDDNGFLYKETPVMSISDFVIFKVASSSLDINDSVYPEFFDSLKLFIASLSDVKFVVKEVILEVDGDLELLMQDGLKIFVSEPYDFSSAFDNLKIVLSGNIFKENVKISDISYIDLRFGNRVYYKLKAKQ